MPRDTLIQLRAGTAAEWATAEVAGPALAAGETAMVDNDVVKGDGVTKVASLARVGSGSYGRTLLYKPAGLRRWAAALGDCFQTTATITVPGDSIALGAAANNSTYGTSGAETTDATYGWVGQVRKLFAATYGDTGEGSMLCTDYRATRTGGTVQSATSPMGSGYWFGPGEKITFVMPACTTVVINSFWLASLSASFTYAIDGEAPVTVNDPTGGDVFFQVVRSGLSDAPHTVVINGTGTASKRTYVNFVRGFRGSTGVRVNRMGLNGALSSQMFAGDGTVMNATFFQTATNLGIISFGANDYAAQNPTPTQLAAACSAAATRIAGYGGCTLLVSEPLQALPGRALSLQSYFDAMKSVADGQDHVAYLDVSQVLGTYAQASANGLMYDAIHPNSKGHGIIGRAVHRVLSEPIWPN